MTTEDSRGLGDEHTLPLTIAELIDVVGDRFKADWLAGRSPRIEAYLAGTPADAAPALFRELLLLELELTRSDDLRPAADDYRARFPGFVGVIDELFTQVAHRGAASTAVAVPAPAPPEIVGYEILCELGRGGMGVVYKARQLNLNRICALKMIATHGAVSDEAARRFLAEAKAIAMVQHPNVVQIYQSGQHDGLLFFEMEYVEGGSLAKRLTGTPWSPTRAARLVDSVARAVDEVHNHRIVHRDLKPANILLTADGTPKVADFGLAKSLDPDANQTVAGVILGTPSYMAPEQARGLSQSVGIATDVYALGAILYELLTGRPPFKGETKLEILEKIKTVEPDAPGRLVPGLPGEIEAVCLKCLRKSPAERYDTAGDLAVDLRRFVNGEPTLARPASDRWASFRRSALNPAFASTAVALVLVLCGLAVFLSGRGVARRPNNAGGTPPSPLGVPYVIKAGEFPFDIAARILGDGNRWREMKNQEGRPLTEEDTRKLLPGQTIYLPPSSAR